MKVVISNTPITLSQSLKNINTNTFQKSASLSSLNNEKIINEFVKNKQDDLINVTNKKKMIANETIALSPTKVSSKSQFDRRSFYDNHKWIDEIQEVDDEEEEDDDDDECRIHQISINQNSSYTMNNNEEIEDEENLEDYQDTLSLKAQMNLKLPEESTQIENSKVERDAFDDLIDLSHRVSKEDMMLKRTEENLKLKDEKSYDETSHFKSCESISNTNNSSTNTNGKDYNTSSLPPLPYSFVRLEKSKAKNVSSSNLMPSSSPRPSATRIIIPLNQNKNSISNTNLENSTSSSSSKSTCFSNQSSGETSTNSDMNNKLTASQSQNILNGISPPVSSSPINTNKALLNRSNSYGFSAIKYDDQQRKTSKTNETNKDWEQVNRI